MMDDLLSDDDIIRVIDELKHRIKTAPRTALRDGFNEALNRLIKEHHLGTDPHMFATRPEETYKRHREEHTE